MQSLMDPNLASQQAQTAEPCRQDGPLMHERTDSPLEVTADSAQDLPYAQPAATCLPADSEQSNGPRHKDAKVDDSQVRRYRTAFTKEQIGRLEKEFSRENYLSRPKRCELAADLNLPESTIKVWFQNRRMKDKRQRMALAWPFGVPDPHIYAAYFASLSSYPYGLANHAQLGYPALGIPRTPTPLSPVGLPNPLQARPDLFHSLSSPLARAFPGLDSQQSPSLHSNLGCGLSLQSHYASQLLAQNLALCPGTSSGKPCTCHMFQDRLTGTTASGIGISSLLNSPTSHSISSIQNQS